MKLFDEVISLVNHDEEPIKVDDSGIIFGTDGYGGIYVMFPQCGNLVKMAKENLKYMGTLGVKHMQLDYSSGHGYYIPLDEV